MKAAAYTRFGPPEVLQIKEAETPQPKNNKMLIQILGIELAGEI